MSAPEVTSTRLEIDWSTQTTLPIEFQGSERTLIAHAYQGKQPDAQALVLQNAKTSFASSSAENGDGPSKAGTKNPPEGNQGSGASDDDAAIATVRVHSGCVTGDIFHSLRCDCYQQLQRALKTIIDDPNGVLIYLPYQEGRAIGLVNKIRAYAMQDQGLDTVDANLEIGQPVDARDYAFTAAILNDLGIAKIRLLSNNPAKSQALRKEGIEIVEQVSLSVKPSAHNKAYLETKRKRMEHKI